VKWCCCQLLSVVGGPRNDLELGPRWSDGAAEHDDQLGFNCFQRRGSQGESRRSCARGFSRKTKNSKCLINFWRCFCVIFVRIWKRAPYLIGLVRLVSWTQGATPWCHSFLFLAASFASSSYPGQGCNSASGHFVWLAQSSGTVSYWTFVPYLLYQLSKSMLKTLFSHPDSWLTNGFAEYEQWTLYGALVVTPAMLLHLIYCFTLQPRYNARR